MWPRVLVVEDVAALRRSYALTLERFGYTALEAAHLEEALDVAALGVPDVLVVDERVIRSDPAQLRRVTAHPRLSGVLIVALTAELRRRKELVELGAHAVVEKPVTDQGLIGAVMWVLDVYRLLDGLEEVG